MTTTAYWHMHDMGAGWWILMSLGWIVFWGLIVWAVVNVARQRDRGEPGQREPSAREVLDRRFAEGAIDVEEYERRRAALTRPADRPPEPTARPT